MAQDFDKITYDEMKRKLRELKKLETKIRSKYDDFQRSGKTSSAPHEYKELIWNKYFDLKDERSEHAKYSISKLSLMTKNELKDVINEYLCSIYYFCYKKSGFIDENSFIDAEILTKLELPLYADQVEIKRKFRELAKIYHPDNGGDSTKFMEVMEQYKRNC